MMMMIYDFTRNLMKFWLDIIMLAVPYEGRMSRAYGV